MGMPENEDCLKDFRSKKTILQKKGFIPEHYVELERDFTTCPLFGPATNAKYAARYLARQIKRYNGSKISGIAAYNTGSLRVCTTGRVLRAKDKTFLYSCQKGGLLNQKYVDRVLDGVKRYSKEGGFHG
jgi:soluble lytic murein transglycosylase-like protein